MTQVNADPGRFRAPASVFWAALLVRVAYIFLVTFAHLYRVPVANHHFEFGWETGRVAASVALGHGYHSPFSGETGPTAWMVPGFTLILAGVFKLFGVYSTTSALVIWTFNSLCQAFTASLVFELAARVIDRRNALWSAWIWALYPGIMQYAVKWIWETSLSTFLFAAVLVLALRMAGIGDAAPKPILARHWALFGLLWGAISMSNPTLVLMAPVMGLWILIPTARRALLIDPAQEKLNWAPHPFRGFSKKNAERLGEHDANLRDRIVKSALCVLLAAALASAVAAPWIVRNWLVFHAFIPTRGNFGAEAANAWSPYSNGLADGAIVPTIERAPEHLVYARMGELAYVRMRGHLAWQWARQYPRHFWGLVLLRFYMFWAAVPHFAGPPSAELVRSFSHCFGSIAGLLGLALALRRRLPASGLFALATTLLPLVYYFVFVAARFRNPLEPFLVPLAVYLFQQAECRWGFTLPGLRRLWPATGH